VRTGATFADALSIVHARGLHAFAPGNLGGEDPRVCSVSQAYMENDSDREATRTVLEAMGVIVYETETPQALVETVDAAGRHAFAIEVRDLRHRFGAQQVLKGVDLNCLRGHITTIVGPSGCGKTVLLKHLNLLMRADSGRIVIEGVDVTRLGNSGLDEVRKQFGMLFQAGALFDSMTVAENITFGLRYLTDEAPANYRTIATDCLALVGLKDVEDFKPSELSGGMKKRVALARALKPSCTIEEAAALAMIVGMIPMALGIGEGAEQNAPLGRAVIGGLLIATVATLFFVPVVYSFVRRKGYADLFVE